MPAKGAALEAVHSRGEMHIGCEASSRHSEPCWPSRKRPLAMTCAMELVVAGLVQAAVVLRPRV